ncbi:Flp pilus assembly protein CpaB [Hellea balneolensis]|uniref:Flp pilus assembly protein CpaB n=1 Tax=Hellea balneolensis TaxID=287478 RepID=UPI000415BDD4|nr:Flp pilus assembly protein CpaB [Hellea balneolensis]
MRLNTVVTLGASAAFGVMAVILARGWINEAIESEFRDSRPISMTSAPKVQNTFPVVIAANDLNFGDTLTEDSLRVVEYPEDAVPQGSYTSINEIFTDITKRTVVLNQMRLNEPLMNYKISGPGGKSSLSARISEGYRAAAIRVDDVSGVAGFIVPGDFVDVIFTRDNPQNTQRQGDQPDLIADVLLQNIKVLGIDQNLNENSSTADVARTVTVEVKTADAQSLHLALESGTLSLTLRSAGETALESSLTVKASQLGKVPAKSIKRQLGKPKIVTSKAERPNVAQVTIIRGETRDEVSVLREDTKLEMAGG